MNRREFLARAGKVAIVLPAGSIWVSCAAKSSGTDAGQVIGTGGTSVPVGTGGTPAGSGGTNSSTAGRAAGTGGSVGGTAGKTAGAGGGSAGGGSAGTGGASAGTGGSSGTGGTTLGSGGAGGTGGSGTSGTGGSSGSGGTGGSSGSGGGSKTCANPTETIASNHGHVLTVSMADATTGADKTYDIMGTAGHTHMVTITAAMFTMLKAGTTISTTSTSGVGLSGAHTHGIMVVCAT